MKKLSDKTYWNSLYPARRAGTQPIHTSRTRDKLKAIVKRFAPQQIIDNLRNYGNYQLWERFYRDYLPPEGLGLKAVEIGSAPGHWLVKLHQRRGYEPYGIEYAERGVEANRNLFAASGLNPDHVIHADFLSDDLHCRYANNFDIVLSRGFIEHFDDVDHIIALHMNLTAPGGILVISIPNFSGLNYRLMSFFHHENLDIHNTHIMNLREFRRLFQREGIETKFCGYFGTFNFGLFNTKPSSPKRHILRLCTLFQVGLNALFLLFLGKRGLETGWASPHLLFIGAKHSNGASAP
jgi:2-polyprenyl-3-methyl-5-hydroxy-6-metoxy-1,4-benzoquinol methylase